jgi:hypothetical protein
MNKLSTNTEAAGGLLGFLFLLFAVGMFLAALVLLGIILFAVSVVLGVVLLIGMVLLWFGPSGWKPFIMMGMIVILALMVVLLALR